MEILIACILANISIAFIFKLFPKYGIDTLQAIVANYAVCVIMAGIHLQKIPVPERFWEMGWFPYSILLGFLFIFGFNIVALTIKHYGMMFTTIMQKMAMVMTVAVTILVYHESSGPMKLIGILMAVISIILINLPDRKDSSTKSFNKTLLYFPIITFITSGIIEIILYYLEVNKISNNADINFVAFLFGMAGILGFFAVVYQYFLGRAQWNYKNVVAGIFLGVPNFYSIYLLLRLINEGFEGSFVFPLVNVCVIAAVGIIGILVFREKSNALKLTGLLLAIGSIVLISYSSLT